METIEAFKFFRMSAMYNFIVGIILFLSVSVTQTYNYAYVHVIQDGVAQANVEVTFSYEYLGVTYTGYGTTNKYGVTPAMPFDSTVEYIIAVVDGYSYTVWNNSKYNHKYVYQ